METKTPKTATYKKGDKTIKVEYRQKVGWVVIDANQAGMIGQRIGPNALTVNGWIRSE